MRLERELLELGEPSIQRAQCLLDIAFAHGDAGENSEAYNYAKRAVDTLDAVNADTRGSRAEEDLLDALGRMVILQSLESAELSNDDEFRKMVLSDAQRRGFDPKTARDENPAALVMEQSRIHNLYSGAYMQMASQVVDEKPEAVAELVAKAREISGDRISRAEQEEHIAEKYPELLEKGPRPALPRQLLLEIVELRAKTRLLDEPRKLQDVAAELGSHAAEARASGLSEIAVRASLDAASAARRAGSPSVAQAHLHDAIGSAQATGGDAFKIPILLERAECARGEEDWEEVLGVCRRGVDELEGIFRSMAGPHVRNSFLRNRVRLYQLGAESAFVLGDLAASIQFGDLSKARGFSARRSGGAMRRQDFDKLTDDLSQAIAVGGPTIDIRASRRQLWLQQIVDAGSATSHVVRATSPANARLPVGAALLYYYWVEDRHLLVYTIRDGKLTCERIEFSAAEQSHLTALWTDPKQAANWSKADWTALAAILLPARTSEVVTRASEVYISPHGVLHRLAFHALPIGDQYLVRRVPVTYVPSLHRLVHAAPRRPKRGFVAAVEDDGRNATLTGLAESATGWCSTLRTAGWTATCTEPVTATALRAHSDAGDLDRTRLAVLACHGADSSSLDPFEAKLELADRAVDGLELSQLSLDTDLLVFGACDSAVGRATTSSPDKALGGMPGDEILGLAGAAFAAGASRFVGSLWNLRLEYARAVIDSLVVSLSAGETSPAQAFQDAVVSQGIDARRPMEVWAPLILMSNVGS